MRKPVLLVVLSVFLMSIGSTSFAQNEQARRRPPDRPAAGRQAPPRTRPPQARPAPRPPQTRQAVPRPPQSRVAPRPPQARPVPNPPQRYVPGQRNYQRQYHYNGGWYFQVPRPYQYRYPYNHGYRIVVCQPSYVIFVGYDFYGRPILEFYYGHCNVPGHYHNSYFYGDYR